MSSLQQRLDLGNIPGIEVSCSTLWFANRNQIPLGCSGPVRDWKTGIWHILWSMHSSYEELFRMKGLVASSDTEVLPICDPILDDASLGRGNGTLLTSGRRLHGLVTRDSAESPATDTPGPSVQDTIREVQEFFAPRNLDDPLLRLLTDEDREPCTPTVQESPLTQIDTPSPKRRRTPS